MNTDTGKIDSGTIVTSGVAVMSIAVVTTGVARMSVAVVMSAVARMNAAVVMNVVVRMNVEARMIAAIMTEGPIGTGGKEGNPEKRTVFLKERQTIDRTNS